MLPEWGRAPKTEPFPPPVQEDRGSKKVVGTRGLSRAHPCKRSGKHGRRELDIHALIYFLPGLYFIQRVLKRYSMLLLPIASLFSHVVFHPNTIATKLCRHVEPQQLVLVNVVLGPHHSTTAVTVWITRHGKTHPITGHQPGQLRLAVQWIQPFTKHIRYFRGVAHRDTVFAVAGQGHIRLRWMSKQIHVDVVGGGGFFGCVLHRRH